MSTPIVRRPADQPFTAKYPCLLTHGIDHPQTSIYRAIVAGCLGGLEYQVTRPEIDPSRVGIVGDDLALISASRRQHSVSAVQGRA